MLFINFKSVVNYLDNLSFSLKSDKYFVGVGNVEEQSGYEITKNIKCVVSDTTSNDLNNQKDLAAEMKSYISNSEIRLSLNERNNCSFEIKSCLKKDATEKFKINLDHFPDRLTVKDCLVLGNLINTEVGKYTDLLRFIPSYILKKISSEKITKLRELVRLKQITDQILNDHSISNEQKIVKLSREGVDYKVSKVLFSCESYEDLYNYLEILDTSKHEIKSAGYKK